MMMNAIQPDVCAFLNGKKHIEIILNEKVQQARLFFTSSITISYQEELDPEYQCGWVDWIFMIDFRENTYQLEKFILNYAMEKCNPNQQPPHQDHGKEEKEKRRSRKYQYLVPAAAITGAAVATPFLLGALGGKKRRNTTKSRKNTTVKK